MKNVYEEAIFVQIDQETVTVFRHGLHDLEVKSKKSRGSGNGSKMSWQSMIEGKKNQPIRFMQGTEIIELSVIEATRDKITGSDGNGDEMKILTQDVLFAYSAKVKSNGESPKVWTDAEVPKPDQFLSDLQGWQVEQLPTILKSVRQSKNKFGLKLVTRAGHILQGRLKSHDADAICMEIKEQTIMVFKHALSAIHLINAEDLMLESELDSHIQEEKSSHTVGDLMLESEPFKFITYDRAIEFSQIKTSPSELTGTDESGKSLSMPKTRILFAYPVKAVSNDEPLAIYTQVEDQKSKPTQEGDEPFQIETANLKSAMKEKSSVRILTHRGYVLEGKIEHFDKNEIHLQINDQTVIVYRHGIYEFSTNILEVGQCLLGNVRNIIPEGAFVKLYFVTLYKKKWKGFIPRSELTLEPINDPSDVVQVDQEVEVIVINLNEGNSQRKLPSLRLKSKHDEWVNRVKEKYRKGSKHRGIVTNVDPELGTFVEFEKGITGLIRDLNMQGFHELQEGHEIDVIISSINYEKEYIGLTSDPAYQAISCYPIL